MSTHATITVVMGDTIMMNGITYDGYLDYTGRALLKYFNDSVSASKLTKVNEMRSIDLDTGEIDCYESSEYYPHQLNSIYDWYKLMPVEEYNYIFIDGKWFLYSPAKLFPLQDEDKYEGPLLGEAQIVPRKIQDNSELMEDINTTRNKSLILLTQKALAPIDGQCSLGLYDSLRVRIQGNFDLEYDLDSNIWRYPFYNGIGLAYIIYNSVVKRYEAAAEEKQCAFRKEDEPTVVKVMNYWEKITSFDRAKNVFYDEDYLHYFLDTLGGMDTEYYTNKMKLHKKGYVQKKIDNLINSMSDLEKRRILSVFKKQSCWDEHISADPVFDYKNNVQKYGTGYKDMKEELEKDEKYIKVRDLRDKTAIMCRESFMNQVSKLVARGHYNG